MSANSPQKTPAINDWLKAATVQLVGAGIGSAKLDAEIILAHTLRKTRTFLHAHGDELLSLRHQEIADARLQLRLDRTPIAYIIGHKEFYGRLFHVTPSTLIPRPESEAMITLFKKLLPKNASLLPEAPRLVDIGTGSGCLGITAKLEAPHLDVTLLDTSRHALKVAEQNAKNHHTQVTLLQSNLLEHYPFKADFILANLPYVDVSWERSPETAHEPDIALLASDNGLHLIKKLIQQASQQLTLGGYLILEADPRQHKAITRFAQDYHFRTLTVEGFAMCLQLQNT